MLPDRWAPLSATLSWSPALSFAFSFPSLGPSPSVLGFVSKISNCLIGEGLGDLDLLFSSPASLSFCVLDPSRLLPFAENLISTSLARDPVSFPLPPPLSVFQLSSLLVSQLSALLVKDGLGDLDFLSPALPLFPSCVLGSSDLLILIGIPNITSPPTPVSPSSRILSFFLILSPHTPPLIFPFPCLILSLSSACFSMSISSLAFILSTLFSSLSSWVSPLKTDFLLRCRPDPFSSSKA